MSAGAPARRAWQAGLVDSTVKQDAAAAAASSFRRLSSDRQIDMQRHVGGRRERTPLGLVRCRVAERHARLKQVASLSVMFRKTAWCIGIRNPRENDFLCLLRSEISWSAGRTGQPEPAGRGWTALTGGKSVAIIRRRTDADRLSRPDYRPAAAAAAGRVAERSARTTQRYSSAQLVSAQHGSLLAMLLTAYCL